MPDRYTPPVLPTLFPIEDTSRDWTESACLILVIVGVLYFATHFAVAFMRGTLS